MIDPILKILATVAEKMDSNGEGTPSGAVLIYTRGVRFSGEVISQRSFLAGSGRKGRAIRAGQRENKIEQEACANSEAERGIIREVSLFDGFSDIGVSTCIPLRLFEDIHVPDYTPGPESGGSERVDRYVRVALRAIDAFELLECPAESDLEKMNHAKSC